MTRKEYHVVGCGAIGIEVARKLFKNFKSLKKLHVWDHNIVKQGDLIFPKRYMGKPRVEAFRDMLVRETNNYAVNNYVEIHNKKASSDTFKCNNKQVIINCLDDKAKRNIKCTLAVSFDGNILILQDGKIKSFVGSSISIYPFVDKKLIRKAADVVEHAIRYPKCYIGKKNKTYMITNKKNTILFNGNKKDMACYPLYDNEIAYHKKNFVNIMGKYSSENFPFEGKILFKLPDGIINQLTNVRNNKEVCKILKYFGTTYFLIQFNKSVVDYRNNLKYIEAFIYPITTAA
jgi:hypothetical protein